MNQIKIEPLNSKWIPQVVDIHMKALPEDFLPGLGFNFLNDIFYPSSMISPHGKVYIAIKDEHTVGFIVVTKNSSSFFRSILQNNLWGFFKTGLITSLSSFKQLKKNVEILISSFSKPQLEDYGEIYEIAVQNEYQGQGVGSELVGKSIEYLQEQGIQGIKIKTRKNNSNWINFFLKKGWRLAQKIDLIGQEYVVLCSEFKGTKE